MKEAIYKILLYSFITTAVVVVWLTYANAYASPDKVWRVSINRYGEADVEFWLIFIPSIPIFLKWVWEGGIFKEEEQLQKTDDFNKVNRGA